MTSLEQARPGGRHVPMRRCVRCRASAPRATLLRVARDGGGRWQLDETTTMGGRGAWLCKACADVAEERDLKRAFHASATSVVHALRARAIPRRTVGEE